MPSNILDISHLNPLKFIRESYANPAPYNSNFWDDWRYPETIPGYVEGVQYFQPFQKNDIIYLHFLANYSPHNISLYSCNGTQVDTFAASHVTSSIEISGLRAFKVAIALDDYDEGNYYMKIKSGNPVIDTLISEKFSLKTLHTNSILFQYTHDENDYGVAFELGDEFRLRVHGGIVDGEPGTNRRVFIDQIENMDQLSAKSFYTEKLIIGDALGVPFYMTHKINEILRCSTVLIDGKQYRANDGSKWEPFREKDFPMVGWSLEVRPATMSDSKRFIADGEASGDSSVVWNIEGRGFGPITGPASSNVIQIESIS